MSFVVIGAYSHAVGQLMGSLAELGQAITLARSLEAVPDSAGVTMIVPLEASAPLVDVAAAATARGWSWIGWDCSDSPALALAAYQAGARAVLPPALTPVVLRHTLDGTSDLPQAAGIGHRRNGRREYLCWLHLSSGRISSASWP